MVIAPKISEVVGHFGGDDYARQCLKRKAPPSAEPKEGRGGALIS